MTRTRDSGAEHSTSDAGDEDEWSALDADKAVLWRGLDAVQANTAAAIRRARAALAADKVDALDDPYELAREGRRALEKLASRAHGRAAEATTVTQGDLAAAYWQRIAEQREAAPTGFARLDQALGGGLQPGRLMIVLGAPGKGKTTLANQIAEHVASACRPVVYVTMEDPAWALLAKTIARMGRLDYGAVLQGRAAIRQAINATLAELAARPSAQRLLYMEQPGRLSLAALQERAAEHFATFSTANGGGPGVLVLAERVTARRLSADGPTPRPGARAGLHRACPRLTEPRRVWQRGERAGQREGIGRHRVWGGRAGRDRRRRQAQRGARVQGLCPAHRQEPPGRYLHA